jgi:uncharacterized membrane protein (DUF2068 family)
VADELWLQGPDGVLYRCLRCGAFVTAPRTRSGPLAQAPLVPRGSHGRKLRWLRLIAAERGVRAVLLFVAAIASAALATRHDAALNTLARLTTAAHPLADQLGWNIDHSKTLAEVSHLLAGRTQVYYVMALALTAYGITQLVEAGGLWWGKRWAEYLAVVATSAFVPLEVYEIVHKPTVVKAGALVANLVIVVYLVYRGRLFGVRGGHAAVLAEAQATTLLAELDRRAGRRAPTPVR